LKRPGRKSIASLNVVQLNADRPKVLAAPKGLTEIERDIFHRTARLNKHVTEANIDMLAAYAQAAAKAKRLAKKDDAASTKAWDQAARVMVLMARSLRITNQSQVHKDTAARGVRKIGSQSVYDLMSDDE
jgi:hypothetical protein